MSFFGFSSGIPIWYELLFHVGSMLTGLFLLILAGLAFMQLYRHPRESWWFLAAIGVTLFNKFCLEQAMNVAFYLISALSTPAPSEIAMFLMNAAFTIVGLGLVGSAWYCVLRAVSASDRPDPGADLSSEQS